MSYIALYRKYRPITFEGIIGQEDITKILKNQIKSGKISHAYIFSGTRGTGKTSAAKVFARAINCLHPKNGEPCNECEVCKNILEGNTTDVIEMDAASNNSVENIRQIRQEVVYATIDVKYRVYIIDEVHMLTTSAFNALLKTLEEPPENVVFILATTEQHKIPVTILSRCLKFEFNRLSEEALFQRMQFVLNSEKIEYEEEACRYIAKLADGAARDALSILERCISETQDILKYEDVLRIVGAIHQQVIEDTVAAILEYRVEDALEKVDQVIQKGKDLRQFSSQITEKFLAILIEQKNNQKERIIKIIDRMSKLDNDIRMTSTPAIVLKACIVELCSVKQEMSQNGKMEDLTPIFSKIEELERQVIELKRETKAGARIESNSNKKTHVESVQNSSPEIKKEKDLPVKELKEVEEVKKQIIEKGKIKVYSAMAGASIFLHPERTIIMTQNAFAYNILKSEDSMNVISEVLKEKYQIDQPIRVELQEKTEDKISKLEKILNENQINYTPMD